MTDETNLVLRDKGFAFFGAITASLSHEINNVFAIINELAGLLDDFFVAADKGAPLNLERLRKTTRRIAKQVDRGKTQVKRLNQFAHTVDKGRAMVELNESAEAVATLCRRFGVLRSVEIQPVIPEDSPHTNAKKFDLQHVIYRCVEIALGASREGDALRIEVEPGDGGGRVVCTSASPVEDIAEAEAMTGFLGILVEEMQGKLEAEIVAGEPVRLTVSFPGDA